MKMLAFLASIVLAAGLIKAADISPVLLYLNDGWVLVILVLNFFKIILIIILSFNKTL